MVSVPRAADAKSTLMIPHSKHTAAAATAGGGGDDDEEAVRTERSLCMSRCQPPRYAWIVQFIFVKSYSDVQPSHVRNAT